MRNLNKNSLPCGAWSFLGGFAGFVAAYLGLYISRPAWPLLAVIAAVVLAQAAGIAVDLYGNKRSELQRRATKSMLCGGMAWIAGWVALMLR